ncbi:MAG: lipocalin-like domain-containing protein [Hyphomicrobiales bacterium]
MNVKIALAAALFHLFTSVSYGQGFAGLGIEGDDYAQVTPGKAFDYPKDHGAHPDFRIEWWYVTANLKDEAGIQYGVQWTLFRQAMTPPPQLDGWRSQQVWLGHAALSSPGIHLSGETVARGLTGQAGVTTGPLAAWIDDWSLTSIASANTDALSSITLKASTADFSYALTLNTDKNLIFHGQSGVSTKSELGQSSYYYSQPFYDVSGALNVSGVDINVSGKAWLDREWSSQPLSTTQSGWDWFSIHLDNGDKVMLFRLRDTAADDYYSGTWISKSGNTETLPPESISFVELKRTGARDVDVPTQWRLEVPSKKLDIETTALNEDSWMDTSIRYWEGPINVSGSHNGVGYLEMTGYDNSESK